MIWQDSQSTQLCRYECNVHSVKLTFPIINSTRANPLPPNDHNLIKLLIQRHLHSNSLNYTKANHLPTISNQSHQHGKEYANFNHIPILPLEHTLFRRTWYNYPVSHYFYQQYKTILSTTKSQRPQFNSTPNLQQSQKISQQITLQRYSTMTLIRSCSAHQQRK